MTDLFERRLAERLQAHPLPDEIFDLGIRTARLGERMRRRRIAGAVLAVVVLLMIPAAAGLWRLAAGTDESQVISPTTLPQAPAGPKAVVLDLGHRPQGAAPEVGTVRGKSAWLPSGTAVKLPAGQFGSIAEYGSGLAWLTRTGGQVRLNVSPERLPNAANGSDVTGVEPGPSGSVMIRTKAGPVFLTSDGKLLAPPSQPELRTKRIVATADAIWVDNGGQVFRVPMADLERGSFKPKAYKQWQKVILGDPRADRVLVINDLGCQTLVNGSTAEPMWTGCDWQLNAFSSDGRLGAGHSVAYGTIGIIDLSSDTLALTIDPDMTPVGTRMVFDEAGRLNFTVGNPASGGPVEASFAFMACDLAGQCWFSTARYAERIDFVLPNRK